MGIMAAAQLIPLSGGEWSPQPEVMEPPLELNGAMYAYDPKEDPSDDNFRAAGDLYRLMTEKQKKILIENTARNIAPVTLNIKYRHAVHCFWADEDYGVRMAAALELPLNKVKELTYLPHAELIKRTLDE